MCMAFISPRLRGSGLRDSAPAGPRRSAALPGHLGPAARGAAAVPGAAAETPGAEFAALGALARERKPTRGMEDAKMFGRLFQTGWCEARLGLPKGCWLFFSPSGGRIEPSLSVRKPLAELPGKAQILGWRVQRLHSRSCRKPHQKRGATLAVGLGFEARGSCPAWPQEPTSHF